MEQEIEILSGAYGSGAVPMRFVEREEPARTYRGEIIPDEPPRKVYETRHWFMDCQHCNSTQTYCEACLQRQARFDQYASQRDSLQGRAEYLMTIAKRSIPKGLTAKPQKGMAQDRADLIGKLWIKPEVQAWRDAVKACWELGRGA